MLVQAGLCQTCSETTLLVFPRGGSYIATWANFVKMTIIMIHVFFLQLKDFIAGKADLGSGQRAFEHALEKTVSNIQWMERNYDTIKYWLTERKYFNNNAFILN